MKLSRDDRAVAYCAAAIAVLLLVWIVVVGPAILELFH